MDAVPVAQSVDNMIPAYSVGGRGGRMVSVGVVQVHHVTLASKTRDLIKKNLNFVSLKTSLGKVRFLKKSFLGFAKLIGFLFSSFTFLGCSRSRLKISTPAPMTRPFPKSYYLK